MGHLALVFDHHSLIVSLGFGDMAWNFYYGIFFFVFGETVFYQYCITLLLK